MTDGVREGMVSVYGLDIIANHNFSQSLPYPERRERMEGGRISAAARRDFFLSE